MVLKTQALAISFVLISAVIASAGGFGSKLKVNQNFRAAQAQRNGIDDVDFRSRLIFFPFKGADQFFKGGVGDTAYTNQFNQFRGYGNFGAFNSNTYGFGALQGLIGYGGGGGYGGSGYGSGFAQQNFGQAVYGYGGNAAPSFRGYSQGNRAFSGDFLRRAERKDASADEDAQRAERQSLLERAQEAQLNQNFQLQGSLLPGSGGPPLRVQGNAAATTANVRGHQQPQAAVAQGSALAAYGCVDCHVTQQRGGINLSIWTPELKKAAAAAVMSGSMPHAESGMILNEQQKLEAVLEIGSQPIDSQ